MLILKDVCKLPRYMRLPLHIFLGKTHHCYHSKRGSDKESFPSQSRVQLITFFESVIPDHNVTY